MGLDDVDTVLKFAASCYTFSQFGRIWTGDGQMEQKWLSLISSLLPALAALVGLLSMFLFLSRGTIRSANLDLISRNQRPNGLGSKSAKT